MHWNYRILSKKVENDVEYAIYEVHYDNDNQPISCTENPIRIDVYESDEKDPIDSINWILEAIKKATEKPILDYYTLKEDVRYSRRKKLKQIEKLYSKKIN